MDIYHIWCNLKPGTGDIAFCHKIDAYFGHLRDEGLVIGHRITRCKLGLAPKELPEFHIMLEVEDMAQLEAAFQRVASRTGVVEDLHHHVNSLVSDAMFAIYRDFPDKVRETGGEKF
jgi:hypothetical protein